MAERMSKARQALRAIEEAREVEDKQRRRAKESQIANDREARRVRRAERIGLQARWQQQIGAIASQPKARERLREVGSAIISAGGDARLVVGIPAYEPFCTSGPYHEMVKRGEEAAGMHLGWAAESLGSCSEARYIGRFGVRVSFYPIVEEGGDTAERYEIEMQYEPDDSRGSFTLGPAYTVGRTRLVGGIDRATAIALETFPCIRDVYFGDQHAREITEMGREYEEVDIG